MKHKTDFYLPSLDGFRAVAALLVFVSHAGWAHIVPGGFGVTMFFFLSGYLITTLLRREYEQNGSVNLKHFYLRRAYRIFPPMYLVLFSILLLGKFGFVNNPASFNGILAQMLQITNYYILSGGEKNIVLSTGTYWSLAVEEHFYIIFPMLLIFCYKRWRNADIAKIFIAICVLELIWRCILVFGFGSVSDRTYLATDTRFDSLLFGCIMGVWMNPALDAMAAPKSKFGGPLLLMGAVSVLLFTLLFRNDIFRETVRYTIQSMALFPIFWLAVKHPTWPVFRILNLGPMKYLGAISYVFYLSHLFWIYVAHSITGSTGIASALIAFALTMAFSAVVHHTVERPFANLRRRLHEQSKGKKPSASNTSSAAS